MWLPVFVDGLEDSGRLFSIWLILNLIKFFLNEVADVGGDFFIFIAKKLLNCFNNPTLCYWLAFFHKIAELRRYGVE